MSWKLLDFIFWNPGVKIPGILFLFYLHPNAYMALWILYCELFVHLLNNTYDLRRITDALKARADVIAIRND